MQTGKKLFLLLDLGTACGQRHNQSLRSSEWQIVPVYFEVKMRIRYTKYVQVGRSVSSHSSTSIIKFADDTVVLGLISKNDETAYLDEVERLTSWCQDNYLSLNVSKTKKLIVDFRKRQQRPYTPLMISGTPVERVSSFKYLGVNIFTGPDLDYTHSNRLRKPGIDCTICDSWGNSGSHQLSWKRSIQGP